MCVLINVMSLHKIKEEGDCCQRKRADLRETRKKMIVYVASGSPLPSTPFAGEFPFGICLLDFPLNREI